MIAELAEPATLPAGWQADALGSLAKVVGGGTPKTTEPTNFADVDGIPWITPADLGKHSDKVIAHGARYLSEQGLKTSSAQLLPAGTVIMSSRAPIGYLAVAGSPVATNQGCKSFICGEKLDPNYLYHYLRYARPLIDDLASGTTFSEISASNAAKIPVVYPPIEEQRRIAVKLDDLLGRVAATRERLDRVPGILRRLRHTLLDAATTGRLTSEWRVSVSEIESSARLMKQVTEDRLQRASSAVRRRKPEADFDVGGLPALPKLWSWVRAEELTRPERALTYGVIKLGETVPDGIPTLRSSDVRFLRVEESNVKKIAPSISAQYERTVLTGDEVVITVRGSLGGVAVVPEHMKGFNVSREVAVLAFEERLSTEYLCFAMASPLCQRWLMTNTTGTVYTGINIEDLRRLPIPLPPIAEQLEIARRLTALLSLCDDVGQRHYAASRGSDLVPESILSRAFAGEL